MRVPSSIAVWRPGRDQVVVVRLDAAVEQRLGDGQPGRGDLVGLVGADLEPDDLGGADRQTHAVTTDRARAAGGQVRAGLDARAHLLQRVVDVRGGGPVGLLVAVDVQHELAAVGHGDARAVADAAALRRGDGVVLTQVDALVVEHVGDRVTGGLDDLFLAVDRDGHALLARGREGDGPEDEADGHDGRSHGQRNLLRNGGQGVAHDAPMVERSGFAGPIWFRGDVRWDPHSGLLFVPVHTVMRACLLPANKFTTMPGIARTAKFAVPSERCRVTDLTRVWRCVRGVSRRVSDRSVRYLAPCRTWSATPGTAERGVGVRVDRGAQLLERHLPHLGHRPHRVRHEVRRVGPSALTASASGRAHRSRPGSGRAARPPARRAGWRRS